MFHIINIIIIIIIIIIISAGGADAEGRARRAVCCGSPGRSGLWASRRLDHSELTNQLHIMFCVLCFAFAPRRRMVPRGMAVRCAGIP